MSESIFGSEVSDANVFNAPDNEGDFLSDLGTVFEDAVDSVDLGDDGGLNLVFHQDGSDSDQAAPHADGQADGQGGTQADGYDAGTHEAGDDSGWEQRYKDLQSFSDQRSSEMQGQINELMGAVQTLTTQGQPAAEESLEDTLDPGVRDALGALVQENFETLLVQQTGMGTDDLRRLGVEHSVRGEIREMVNTYGDEFVGRQDAIIEVMQSLPDSNPTFEEALEIVLLFEDQASGQEGEAEYVDDGTGEPPLAPQQETYQPVADDGQRMAALQAAQEAGASPDVTYTQERTIDSTRDAMQAAMEELG